MTDLLNVEVVSLDATGTLIRSPKMLEIYSEVLARHGIVATPSEIGQRFRLVWKELDCSTPLGQDRFASHPQGARGWWQWFLERLCQHLGSQAPSRFAAAELFDRFGSADAWELYPEVRTVLETLQERGFRLMLLSNWDERLLTVLDGLKLSDFFEERVLSTPLGLAKPNPELFRYALRQMACPAENFLHVGDSVSEDVEGALAVGCHALWLDRTDETFEPPDATDKGTEPHSLKTLLELPERLALVRPPRGPQAVR